MSERILPATTPWEGVPYVGCACTVPVGSDCYPATVVWVSDDTVEHTFRVRDSALHGDLGMFEKKVRLPKRIAIRYCGYRGVEGHSNAFTEQQKYEYFDTPVFEGEPENSGEIYSWRPKRGNYVRAGTSYKSSAAQGLGFGYRRAYRDPSF